MAITIDVFALDKDYANDTILTEAQKDAALIDGDVGSVQYYMNTKIRQNLLQFTRDAYPDGVYEFTDDGVKSLWNANGTLFDKQNSSAVYAGGDIDIETGTDIDWEDVANADIDFIPDAIGYYRVSFTFVHHYTFTATTLGQLETRFRLTDGSNASRIVKSGCLLPAPGAGSCEVSNTITIEYIVQWTTVSLKNVKLQKWNDTTTAVNSNEVAASTTEGEVSMRIEKI